MKAQRARAEKLAALVVETTGNNGMDRACALDALALLNMPAARTLARKQLKSDDPLLAVGAAMLLEGKQNGP